ncbi:RNA polymerase sigma factor [Mangrovicella endophytica]|uniref:RNA polymerase sigma factor n=1 Tax=Mangrovicella endophytica TaxID=2066697 RepID=UPI000C9E584A|nr:RNA polymerase sigma factor [Mangrovicella endophytica]
MTTAITQPDDDLVSSYLRHLKTLTRALRRRTGSQDLAEEALQETWFRLARLGPSAEPVRDSQALILRIAGNIATDIIRRETRLSSRHVSDEAILAAIADSVPSPEVVAIDRDELRRLVAVLAELSEKARAVLLMSRCDELPYIVIGKRLGISESMVTKYMAQALRHCRDRCRTLA